MDMEIEMDKDMDNKRLSNVYLIVLVSWQQWSVQNTPDLFSISRNMSFLQNRNLARFREISLVTYSSCIPFQWR
jgi:hypothetical protein